MAYSRKVKNMVRRLHEAGISDMRVLKAMAKIPREKFIPPGMEHQAYEEKALPIGFGQTISHPYTVAVMTQTLQISAGDRVLEIGTGSGYQCAVLCEMGAQVFSVELVAALANKARQALSDMGYNYAIRNGDGSLGWAAYAPFNKIIVTAGAPVTPAKLLEQLQDGGRMVIPVGEFEEQNLELYTRNDSQIERVVLEKFKFVPMRGKEGWK